MSNRFSSTLVHAGAFRRALARTKTVGLLVMVAAVCAASCDNGPQLTEEAQPLEDAVMKLATVYDDRIVFPASAEEQLADVAVGDVIVSSYDHGLIRRVDAIKSAKSTLVFRTSEASLTDAVVNGSTGVTIQPGAGPASVGPMSGAEEFVGQTFSADLSNEVIFTAEGVTLRIKQGSLVFKAGIDVGFEIKDKKVTSARAIASGDLQIDLTTEVEGQLLLDTHKEKVLWMSPELAIPLPPIGMLPVKATGRLVVTGIFDAKADGRVAVEVKQSFVASGEVGLRYSSESGFEQVRSFAPSWTVDDPTLTAETKLFARSAVRTELRVGFYSGFGALTIGGGGVDVWAEPFLAARAQAADVFDWSIEGGLDLGARARLKVLWKDFASKDYQTNVVTKQLLPKNQGDVVPSEPGDCGNGVEDGFESDADCGGGCSSCGAGDECASGADCETGVCDGGACVPSSCADGVLGEGEGDIDCGGACPACDGGECVESWDCASELCEGGACIEPYECENGVLDEGEEDVDCGGACGACAGEDLPLGCDNGARDGDEDDVDCGGSCPPCGGPVCGDGYCDAGEDADCPNDCGEVVCGDGVCDMTESDGDCPADCGGAVCGDGTCDFNGSEPIDCPADCCGDMYCDPGEEAVCDTDCASAGCGDGVCDFNGSEPVDCPADCCGDGYCDPGEEAVCDTDCASAGCGDGVCDFNGSEPVDCPADCCGDGYCDPGEDAVCPADCG